MMKWIERAMPQIILLENVSGAPWDDKVRLLSEIGYAATFIRIDTKLYYIPQTRQRGYLFAIRSSKQENDPRLGKWEDLVKSLKRPASASLDAFMLPNDDPRVLRGRAKLTAESLNASGENRAGRTDWTKCETRHQRCRSTEQLGDKRPLTEWSETTAVTMPGFAWNDWTGAQVNRIHDLMDINTLRMAQLDMDCTYKTMVWNVSQNVDRDTMGRLGLCQCLTPDGVFYVSNRGGPLVGEELLLLQGIPVDDLLLTKESEDNLKDLAGNAMSSTVVGACLLSALIAGHGSSGRTSSTTDKAPLVPRPLMTPTPESITQQFGTYETISVPLKPVDAIFGWKNFMEQAHSSARLCVSEGSEQSIPFVSLDLGQEHLLRCRDCGHSCSSKASRGKFEEHSLEPWVNSIPRIPPHFFLQKLRRMLPMSLTLAGMDLESTWAIDEEWANTWKASVAGEFRLAKISRSVQWQAVFTSSADARLELHLGKKPVWLLFSTKSQHPLARMHVINSNLTQGTWQVCLPQEVPLELQIRGHLGETIESWRRRMGLQGKFLTEVQYECVEISVVSGDNFGINGLYRALPKCGGACGSMHKKITNNDSDGDLYFFLESGRRSLPDADYFVIAPTCHRTCDGEYRETLIRLDPSYRATFFENMNDGHACLNVSAFAHDWRTLPRSAIVLCSQEVVVSTPACLRVPRGDWKLCPELINCRIPSDMIPDFCRTAQVNLNKSQRLLQQLAFCLFRLELPPMLNDWLPVVSEGPIDSDIACATCAPRLPSIRWRRVKIGKTIRFEALEDGQEGAAYERALKHRPQPWLLRLLQDDNSYVSIKIGCNPISLVEQALGSFPADSLLRLQLLQQQSANVRYDWRVVQHVELSVGNFSKLRIKSNKLDASAPQPPHFKIHLRPEQLRSLMWMLDQETGGKVFYEEEVVEAILPTLLWRAEGRVRRPVAIRGGIVADEVGYGKTAITLGLIDSAVQIPEPPVEYRKGFLALKATLVLVPSTLTGQWPSEIRKFLGTSKKVITIKDMASFNKLTVSEIQTADIVVVGFNVLSGEKYFTRLARFCGVNPGSLPKGNIGGRRFAAVYKQCLQALRHQVEQLKTDCAAVFSAICKAADQSIAAEESLVTMDKKKSAYKERKGSKLNETVYKVEKSERDPWEIGRAKTSYSRMKSPPLEIFFWNRIVVDE
jgi:site-specific DNA-cytosine methylase